jgi:hypothetical protein
MVALTNAPSTTLTHSLCRRLFLYFRKLFAAPWHVASFGAARMSRADG